MTKYKKNHTTKENRNTLVLFFALVCFAMACLVCRLAWIQVIKADEYSERAVRQQTSDSIVAATRGNIVDRNGNQLAISATTHTVWVRPYYIKTNGETDAEILENETAEVASLSAILNMSSEDILSVIDSGKVYLKLKKNVDADTAEILAAEKLTGIEITEDAKRYYPMKTFASHILGSTTDDNQGLGGLELQYNSILSGLDGRWITNKDNRKNSLSYGVNKYYAAQDGYTLQLTVDQNIQKIAADAIENTKNTTDAENVYCLIMDPSTGDILAMAQTGEYDPNNPRVPVDPQEAAWLETLSDTEKVNYWNKMWRNFCVCDTYEPGSTFKLITTSIALENSATYLGKGYYCGGSIQVADRTIKCWCYPIAHGEETLESAVGNSCNPVMIQLAAETGIQKYYAGLDSFGLSEKTGIDYPGEALNILQKKNTAGPVGLATMSFGQGIAVTPLSLVTAISSIANDGFLMQPRFVKAILDSSGEVVQEYEPVIKSRSISKQTADDVLSIMEQVVSTGGGGGAKITGYRIGGKTGTATKPSSEGYQDKNVYASFIGVAPVEDPRFVILVVVDHPKGNVHGSAAAVPCAKVIMQSLLQYMEIEPKYTSAQLQAMESKKVAVPELTGQSASDAIGILSGRELGYCLSPSIETSAELVITGQYPKAGISVDKGSEVTLYYEVADGVNDIISEEITEEEIINMD